MFDLFTSMCVKVPVLDKLALVLDNGNGHDHALAAEADVVRLVYENWTNGKWYVSMSYTVKD